jgi:RNA ligase (TIGR02306 family)
MEEATVESKTTRKMAKLATIGAVNAIEGADRIVSVEVGGWVCVTGKDNFKQGDRCIYFEPDAAMPVDHPAFAFLAERSTRQMNGRAVHVLRTIRLKGVYSQGLVLPIGDFDFGSIDPATTPDGEDLSAILGVELYTQPDKGTMGNMMREGLFPTHLIQKTDAERAQNLTGVWDMLRAEGDWVWTEKIDGTSLTVIRDGETLRVCSRNFELKPSTNVYWQVVEKYDIAKMLPNDGDFLQGEIAGPGVQKNPLGLTELRLFIFGVRLAAPALFSPTLFVPKLGCKPLPATVKELLAQVDGMKSTLNPAKQAEGIVFHHLDGKKFHPLGYRSCFKAINRAYESKLADREDSPPWDE